MNCKHGFYGAYGQEDESYTSEIVGLLVGWTDYFTDTRRRVARYQAQLDDAIRRGASLATIERIQLQLTAAKEELALQVAGESSSQEWATLGKAGSLVGIALGAALTVVVIKKILD